MKIDIFDMDEFVKINNLKEVTSGVIFQRGGVPHPEGLLSNEIFGITVKSRRETFAYINLYQHFFHPHIYKVVRALFRNVDRIISGDAYYTINEEGILVQDEKNGETGIEFLYNNWEKIKWKDGDDKGVGQRSERAGLLTMCKKNEVFLTKMIVIPVFYRDIITSSGGGAGKTGDLNKYYANLIRMTSLLRDRDMFGFQYHATNFNIQQQLVNIYDYFKQKVQKKNGIIRKFLMGKTVDNAVRTVITAPNFHGNSPDDMIVDFYHCALPISQACVLAYPFMMQWIKSFFDREIISQPLDKIVYNPEKDEVVKTVRLKNPEMYFNEKYIKNIMDTYIRDPSSRFNPIEVPVEGTNKKYYLHLTGKRMGTGKSELASTMYRKMTITDLLFLAASEVTKDKHMMTTRYPILDEFSTFINKINISSTTKTEPVMINGRVYKWYPVIDTTIPSYKMAAYFVDALNFSHSYLPGLDGDYDGDQVTSKLLYSQEANEELAKYIRTPANFINSEGSMCRFVESEAIQTFYSMTKEGKGRALTKTETSVLLNMKYEEYTFDRLSKMLGTTVNMLGDPTKTIQPEFNVCDVIEIPSGYFKDTTFSGKTTVGRFIFNQLLFARTGLIKHIGYINDVMVDDRVRGIEKAIGNLLSSGKIDPDILASYIDLRDWLGFQLHAVICTSFTPGLLFVSKEVKDKKEQLIKQNRERLESGDPRAGEEIEKELIKTAKTVLKDDPGMELYDSGARGSFGNNYKNMYLIRGPVFNEGSKKYDFIPNALTDGLTKDKFTPHANSLVNGAYPKAVGTAQSGYLGKELNAILQMERLDENPDSDCGSTKFVDTLLPSDKTIHLYDYRFIKEGGQLKCLEPDIIESYKGKVVQMRSVLFCKNQAKCSRCSGLYYHKIGKYFIGLQCSRIATRLTNLNMKKFHENLVKTSKIDPTDLVI